jgi:SAM-dependent methyltransferase
LIVDRAAQCIEACRQRFASDPRVTGYVNQGGLLEMIADASLDFVFSFDVFVHIKREIVEEYLSELGRTLKPGGRGFIHHSNLGAYAGSLRDKLPSFLQKFLTRWHLLDEDHHRTSTMTAELFRALCKQHGLHCTRQELINWRGRRLIDCLSWFERSESGSDESTEVVRNPNFMREAEIVRRRRRTTNGGFPAAETIVAGPAAAGETAAP